MQRVYLSRRNLTSLISKLDRNAMLPGSSACTLVKTDTVHPTYPCSDNITVIAVEDSDYYTDRVPGVLHPADDPEQK